MTSSLDITVAKVIEHDVFRHTPFEYETTTEIGTSLTTLEPLKVALVREQPNDAAIFYSYTNVR